MSVPTSLLKWRGTWVNGSTYNNSDVVRSPITSRAYVLVNGNVLSPSTVDPSVGTPWVVIPSTTPTSFQVGTGTGTGNNGNTTITLPTPFPTTSYFVFPAMNDAIASELSAVVNTPSTFTIYWQGASPGTHTLSWLCIG